MTYWMLSLPEAVCLYLGLAIQTLLRQAVLPLAPLVLTTWGIFIALKQDAGTAQPYQRAVTHFMLSLALTVFFWPDVLSWGRSGIVPLTTADVGSYAASQDPEATIVAVAQTEEVPAELDRALVPPVFDYLLTKMTDTMLGLARMISSEAHRPFHSLLPMQWLLGFSLTADISADLNDWLEGCYRPSMLQDREFENAVTSAQLLPWGNTPVAQALATREMVPGSQVSRGYFRQTNSQVQSQFLSNPGSATAVRCDIYLRAVEMDVQRQLFTTPSPAGTPLSEIFEEELGLNVEEQGRFLIYQGMLRMMQSPTPAPSLIGSYAGASAVAGASGGIIQGAIGARGGLVGALVGLLTGTGSALGHQYQQTVQAMVFWVGVAAWLLYWMPFILGAILLVLVGFFPIVLCWSYASPGRALQPLIYYFLFLLWVLSSPVWYALIGLLSRAGVSLAPQAQDALLSALNWAPQQAYSVAATIIGLAIVPTVLSIVIFVAFLRSMGSLLRAAA
jgi:hypothetical protein